jgi:hypothetical protein
VIASGNPGLRVDGCRPLDRAQQVIATGGNALFRAVGFEITLDLGRHSVERLELGEACLRGFEFLSKPLAWRFAEGGFDMPGVLGYPFA